MTRLGQFRYNGNGELLENGEEYTVFEVESSVEAYPEGEAHPVEMNKGVFVSLRNGNLEEIEGDTPMA